MRLRRITEHVKAQNWTAVALDFFIVVVGVFIGIQVANWNEARGEKALAQRYVDQLSEDIRSDILDISVGVETSQWRYAALSMLLTKADAPGANSVVIVERKIELPVLALENDHSSALINAAYYTRFLDSDRPAYSSLVSAGNANLIANLPAFQCIQSYYALHDETAKFEERLLLFRTDLIRAMHKAGVSIDGARVEDDVTDAIKSDKELAAAMASYRVFSWFHVDVLQRLQDRAEILLETLAAGGVECEFNEETSL